MFTSADGATNVMAMKTLVELEVIRQLRLAGYLDALSQIEPVGAGVRGVLDVAILPRLLDDARFANGIYYGLHRDVGDNLRDFRSYAGTFGKGSLQIVLDRTTGKFWADTDKFNAYQDIVNIVGHMFGEVLPGWWRGWR